MHGILLINIYCKNQCLIKIHQVLIWLKQLFMKWIFYKMIQNSLLKLFNFSIINFNFCYLQCLIFYYCKNKSCVSISSITKYKINLFLLRIPVAWLLVIWNQNYFVCRNFYASCQVHKFFLKWYKIHDWNLKLFYLKHVICSSRKNCFHSSFYITKKLN